MNILCLGFSSSTVVYFVAQLILAIVNSLGLAPVSFGPKIPFFFFPGVTFWHPMMLQIHLMFSLYLRLNLQFLQGAIACS